jgi:hypothetical protein
VLSQHLPSPRSTPSSPAKAGDPVFQGIGVEPGGCGVLDTPLEPVIGLARGETRRRSR